MHSVPKYTESLGITAKNLKTVLVTAKYNKNGKILLYIHMMQYDTARKM